MNTKTKGEITEAAIIAELIRLQRPVLQPFGDNQRYDLVFEGNDKKFYKVQCKTAPLRGGAILIRAESSYRHRAKGSKNYKGQVDFIAVHCHENRGLYMINMNEIKGTNIQLRLYPAKNKQTHIHHAVDYEIEKVLNSLNI